MIATIELFEALKTRFGEGEARVIVKEIEKIENGVELRIEKAFEQKSQVFKDDIKSLKEYMDLAFATKQNSAELEVRLIRAIYISGVVQYLAILASVIAILKFLH